MKYQEYGAAHTKTVILLHGGGLSWWNYREAAEILQQDFHVIVPFLDGHAGSDRHFTTIAANASEIIEWIDAHCGGSVFMIGGLSLGAQILLEMLAKRGDICQHALVESAMVCPSEMTHFLISPMLACSYFMIQKRSFAKLQFKSLRMKPELFEDYYRDTCQIEKADMIAFLQENTAFSLNPAIQNSSAAVQVFFGEKETRGIRRSAHLIGEMLPNCSVHAMKGLYHGMFSMNCAQAYADVIRQADGNAASTD